MIHTQIITCEEYDSFDEMMGAELFVNLKIVNLKMFSKSVFIFLVDT